MLFLQSEKHRSSLAGAIVPGKAAVHGMTLVFIGGWQVVINPNLEVTVTVTFPDKKSTWGPDDSLHSLP